MMSSSSASGFALGSRYLDPRLVYELVVRRMPGELLDYVDSIPGASQDLHCYRIKLVGKMLLSPPRRIPEESKWIMILGKRAWGHAIYSRLCAPPMVDSATNFTSDAGHSMHPHNSSLHSGRILTTEPCSNELRHAAMHNQLSASTSRNQAETFPPLKENSNDVMLDESSGSNSRTHASGYAPLSRDELEQNNHGTLELGCAILGQSNSVYRGVLEPGSPIFHSPEHLGRIQLCCFAIGPKCFARKGVLYVLQ